MSVHSAPHSFMVISDPRTTAIFTHCIVVILCHQYMKVGDLLAMTAMTLLDDSRNWGHFWKIKSIHGRFQYPTYAILNLCFRRRGRLLGDSRQNFEKMICIHQHILNIYAVFVYEDHIQYFQRIMQRLTLVMRAQNPR
jgi:hypothetical protein